MIIVLKTNLSNQEIEEVFHKLESLGLTAQLVKTKPNTTIAILDDVSTLPTHLISQIPYIEKLIRLQLPNPLVKSSKNKAIKLANGLSFGNNNPPIIIAGPCAVDEPNELIELALDIKARGAHILRGGAFKPRTSPYDFQGHGLDALKTLGEAKQITGLPIISEVMSAEQVDLALPYVDILQIGTRNMYNYELLKEVGRSDKTVLLKRAFSATLNEWLLAAEYIMSAGNENVILCERGIRTFETYTRNTLDLSIVAAAKRQTSLPIIVDPSHATGKEELIRPMARAAIACGAHGLMIEVHPQPDKSMSDKEQAITPNQLSEIIADTEMLYQTINKLDHSELIALT